MENRRAIIISLICLIISLTLIFTYSSVRRYEMTSEFGEEVPVVVAVVPIREYEIIRSDMVKTISVFKNYRQPQTVAQSR